MSRVPANTRTTLLQMILRQPKTALKTIPKVVDHSPKSAIFVPTDLSMLRDSRTDLIATCSAHLSALLERLKTATFSPGPYIDNSAFFPWTYDVPPLPKAQTHLIIDKRSPSLFLEALRRTPNHKSPTHDSVPAILLKHMPHNFLAALYNLFKVMAITGTALHEFRQGFNPTPHSFLKREIPWT